MKTTHPSIGSPAPMSAGRIAYLRRRYCRRQANYLWGQKRIVKPVLLPVQFGDGKQIIALRPICTRTHHYVVAINSTPNWFGRDCPDTLHDELDAIYESLGERFGECSSENDPPDDAFKEWPALCLDGGTEWWNLTPRR
jgi:hypothetical protein